MSEWETRRLLGVAEVILGRQRSPQHDVGPHMVPYLRAANVQPGRIDLTDVKSMNFTPREQRNFAVLDGDVLVTEGSGSIASVGASAKWEGPTDGALCFQNTLLRLRARPGTDPRWLAWWAQYAFVSGLFAAVAGGANIYHLSADRVRSLSVALPPLDEQHRIADFLDNETAHLDSLISARTQQLALLEERRGSFLVDLLRNFAAPLLPLRRALTGLTDGPFGSAFTSADYSSEGAAVVRLGNIGFDEYRPSDQARIPLQLYRTLLQHRVLPGDVLIAGLGDSVNHAGRACVAPDLGPAMVKGKCFVARATPGVALPEYLSSVLSSTIGRDALTTRGSTRQMINLEIVRSAVLPLPALEDQVRIVELTQREEMRRKRAMMMLERSVALMSERRQAMITAVVTGQVDVTTASGAAA